MNEVSQSPSATAVPFSISAADALSFLFGLSLGVVLTFFFLFLNMLEDEE